MRRREDRAIEKHTVNFYVGDYPKLQQMYGSRIGAAKIIRDLVHDHIKRVEEDAAQSLNRPHLVDDLDVDLSTEGVQQ